MRSRRSATSGYPWAWTDFVSMLFRICTNGKTPTVRICLRRMNICAGCALMSKRSSPTVCCLRSEEHTSELQSLAYLVCRLLLEKKKKNKNKLMKHTEIA